MIPVLVVPILNRMDLMREMLASIDHPIGRLYVIDNGDCVDQLPPIENVLAQTIVAPGWNLGVSGSWNLAIKANPDAPWWLFVNNDIVFGRGDLERMDQAMNEPERAVRCLKAFGAFGLPRSVVDEVGFFDESFAPIYCEDIDYQYRLKLAGVPCLDVPSTTSHYGSRCFKENPTNERNNSRTYPANVRYYQEKWGGPMGSETFVTPFNKPVDVRYWQTTVERLSSHTWRK